MNTGLLPVSLSLTRILVAVPLLCFRSKYAPEYCKLGLVPNLKFPFTNNFSFELAEPIETVSLLAFTTNVVASTVRSVSYSHLRAHETEADMVCRLLREKKDAMTHRHSHDSLRTI